MTHPSKSKSTLLYALLPLLLAASLALVACRTETEESSAIGLAWEAWNVVQDSYVKADSVDSQEATGNMILSMLDSSEMSVYPFLTKLGKVTRRPPSEVPAELSDVWRAWTLLRAEPAEVTSKSLADAAVEGLLDTLDDESVAHLTPDAYSRAQNPTEENYQGIGAFVVIRNGRLLQSPMRGSPAERAGLKAGDAMLEVDGVSVEGKSLQEVIAMVRGRAGSDVVLLVERPEVDEPLTITVRRGEIEVDSVDRQLLPGAIGHIIIGDFRQSTPDELKNVLDELVRFDTLALILDLRGNRGESLEAAQEVISQFLPGGEFMYEIDRDGTRRDWGISEEDKPAQDLPMVVLVNGLTGNAAEAVAGGLQDAERADIMGTLTLGKGSASVFKELSDGSAIYLPISYWYTPSGRLIQGAGIVPDIEVEPSAQARILGADPQLAGAYDYLNRVLSELVPFR